MASAVRTIHDNRTQLPEEMFDRVRGQTLNGRDPGFRTHDSGHTLPREIVPLT